MDSKPTKHVRPRLRRLPANAGKSINVDDTRNQDASSVASPSQACGSSGLDGSKSPSLEGFSKSVVSQGSFKDDNKRGKLQNTDIEVVPLGRRKARGFRKRQPFSQNSVDDAKLQAQKAALVQAQQAGATGNFKGVDSQFNNVLIPVIPMQFLSKPKDSFNEVG